MQQQRSCSHANVNPEGEREGPPGRGGTRATRVSGRGGGFEGTSAVFRARTTQPAAPG